MSRTRTAVTMVVMFAFGVAAGWLGRVFYTGVWVPGHQIRNFAHLQFWQLALHEVVTTDGEYPATLREAASLRWPGTDLPASRYRDAYGNPIVYGRVERGFVLASFGSDGVSDRPSLENWREPGGHDSSPCYVALKDTIITEAGLVQGCTK